MSRNSSSPDMEISYETTTPVRPLAVKTASSRRPPQRSVAGPSKRATTANKRTKLKKPVLEESEVEADDNQPEHIEIASSINDSYAPPSKVQAKKFSTQATAVPVNGKASVKGKEIPPRDELMEIDEIQDLTHLSAEDSFKPSDRPSKNNGRLPKDANFDRVQKQLQESTKQVEALKKQLESLLHAQAEQETAINDWKEQQESTNETYKAYRKELDEMRRLTLANSSLNLHFLTREAADEEKREAKDQIDSLNRTIMAKDTVINEKNRRIAELQEGERVLQSDLKAEVERAKTLARSKPNGYSRAISEGPNIETFKKAAVLRLYEDFTNILVLNVKSERNEQMDKEDLVFHCIYTHGAELGEADKRSISFSLRQYWEYKEGVLQENVKYTPLELDKETPEFRERLDFLGDTFTFEKQQIQVFLEQLRDHVAGAVEKEREAEEEPREEIIIDLRDDDGEDLYA